MTLRPPPVLWTIALALIGVPAAVGLSLCLGSSGWGWADENIFWLIRLPRTLLAFGTGAALALSGALIQLVTRNPLADPHVLGVTGGASVGALSALLWLPLGVPFAAEMGASVGAIAAMTLVLMLSWRSLSLRLWSAGSGAATVLLVGVMVGAACSAAVAFILSMADEQQLRGLIFWLLGDLNGSTTWWPVWAAVAAAMAMVWPRARELDWLARGDSWAWTLGVPVARRRRVALFAACLATGVAVASAGAIGFVGLVAPHVVRLSGVRSAPYLLPCSALLGGAFLTVADTVARTAIAPSQLPVGVISALVGVPVFLTILLYRGRGA